MTPAAVRRESAGRHARHAQRRPVWPALITAGSSLFAGAALTGAVAPANSPADAGVPALRPPPLESRVHSRVRPLDLRLPTENRALLDGAPQNFYMGVDRTVDEKPASVWEGGQFGFVRNPFKLGGETVFTRFHEGIDIAPTLRDNRGEPLDAVCCVADGRVVFTNTQPGKSNYGNHVIVEHDWGYGPFYSLYGHLRTVDVHAAEILRRGSVIGRLGYTGSGIDRRRAHVHFELNMLLSERFEEWYQRVDTVDPARTPFHGYNLVGLDVAALYLAAAKDPAVSIPEFLLAQETYFKVVAPNTHGEPEVLRRYPWLSPVARRWNDAIACPSWEISLTAAGLPLRIEPSAETVPYPIVSSIIPFHGKHSRKTMGRVGGTGTVATLTPKGVEYINLITGAF
jgi:murein DD-endopeptidase MepM/ murein hydrolase activator NlpD